MTFLLTGCGGSSRDYVFTGDFPEQAGTTNLRIKTLPERTPSLLYVGETLQLVVEVTQPDGEVVKLTSDSRVTWHSQREDVANVSTSGQVTALAPGLVRITAKVDGQEASLVVNVLWGTPVPALTIPAGVYAFNTDTGELTLQGEDPQIPEGWNEETDRLELDNFTLESGAVLNVTGSLPFRVKAEGDITVDGTIDFSGQHGANGADGADDGDVNLFSSGDLTVTGTIKSNGGNGGNGGGYTAPYNISSIAAGNGGQGGDSGRITLNAGDNLNVSGELLMEGGDGGDGGDVTIEYATATATAGGNGGNGGNGGSQGGEGGSGGGVTISANDGGATAG